MGRGKDCSGSVWFVILIRIHRVGRADHSSGFVFFLSWLGFIGWDDGIMIPEYSFCLLRWQGWGGIKIPVDSFFCYDV